MFAYNAQTGKPVWQSGSFPIMSDAKNTWFFGAGPYQRGSIYGEAKGATDRGMLAFKGDTPGGSTKSAIPVTAEASFDEPPEQLASLPDVKEDKPAANAPTSLAPAAAPGATPAAGAQPAPKPATPAPAPPPPAPVPPPAPSVILDQPAPTTATSGLMNALGDSQYLFGTKK